MKLNKSRERFYVECHTDDFGYTSDDCYTFDSEEQLENFLGIHNDYENHVYKEGTDIFGRSRSLGCSECPNNIYSKTEYEIEWDSDNDQ